MRISSRKPVGAHIFVFSTMKNVLTREMEERGYNLREGSGVLRLMETILPILLECWVEATATQHRDMEGTQYSKSPIKDFMSNTLLTYLQG